MSNEIEPVSFYMPVTWTAATPIPNRNGNILKVTVEQARAPIENVLLIVVTILVKDVEGHLPDRGIGVKKEWGIVPGLATVRLRDNTLGDIVKRRNTIAEVLIAKMLAKYRYEEVV